MHHMRDCDHGHHGHHISGQSGHHHWDCCCGRGHGLQHFPTKEEILGNLQEYLKYLQTEVKGVEERIAEFRTKG